MLMELRHSLHENPGLWGRSGVVRGLFGVVQRRCGVVRGRSGVVCGSFGIRSRIVRKFFEQKLKSFRNKFSKKIEKCKLLKYYVLTLMKRR